MKFFRKNTCAGDLFKYNRMAEGYKGVFLYILQMF